MHSAPLDDLLINIGIVAENDVTRDAVVRIIGEDPELRVIGVARDPRAGRTILRSRSLHVLIVALALDRRGDSGLKFISRARMSRNDIGILSLKRGIEEPLLRAAIDAGANACCLAGNPQQRLLRAIKAVSVGGTWLDPEISEVVFRTRNSHVAETPRLTSRERAVLQLITEGYTNAEIATHFSCAVGTVHSHVTNLFDKLGVHDRTSAAVMAMRHGLISENRV